MFDIFLGAGIDQVEQAREGIAEIEATPAAVTDVEDPAHLRIQLRRIGEVRILPADDLAGGRVETAFACHVRLQGGAPGRGSPVLREAH